MGTLTTYDYSVTADTLNGAVSLSALEVAIRASSIVTALDGSYTDKATKPEPRLHIVFKDALSAGDKTTLDGLVAAHDGNPLPDSAYTSTGAPIVHIDAPSEPDGKPVVVMSPSTEGWMTFFTGAGDDKANPPGRGTGQKLVVTWDGTETGSALTKTVEVEFSEPVEVHDGQFFYPTGAATDPTWSHASRWSFSVIMPATPTPPAAAPVNTGNCNSVPTGLGYNILVPAAGDGALELDLATAVPVPASGGGYWNADHETGAITPSTTPGKADWHILDNVPVESFFMRNMPMGNPRGMFDIDTYKAEWISERWKLKLSVSRNETNNTIATWAAGWLMFFRERAT